MSTPDFDEPLLPIKEAARRLGLPHWKLQRAVRRGDVPSYSILNSRKLVFLSEVRASIQRTRTGGGEHE